jgi:predicted nucleic acid-binding protein
VAALVDTNVLVYRHDSRFPAKQRRAVEVLRDGLRDGTVRLPYQALVEFVSVVTRPIAGGAPLLDAAAARREAEELLAVFPIVYPTADVYRTALRGAALYGLSWFDAHLWAHAECAAIPELISEDFEHRRLYGTVRVTDPFQTR